MRVKSGPRDKYGVRTRDGVTTKDSAVNKDNATANATASATTNTKAEQPPLRVPVEMFFYNLKPRDEFLDEWVLKESKRIKERIEEENRRIRRSKERFTADGGTGTVCQGDADGVAERNARDFVGEREADVKRVKTGRDAVPRDMSRDTNRNTMPRDTMPRDAVPRDTMPRDTPRSPHAKFAVLFSPMQCRLCALRFRDTDDGKNAYSTHIEEHVRKRIAAAFGTASNPAANPAFGSDFVCRTLFANEENWLSKKIDLPMITANNDFFMTNKKKVVCQICNNFLSVVWDDENDGWMVKDGVKLGEEFVHKECAF